MEKLERLLKSKNINKLEYLQEYERNSWKSLNILNKNQEYLKNTTKYLIENNCNKDLKDNLIQEFKKMEMEKVELKELIIRIDSEIKKIVSAY